MISKHTCSDYEPRNTGSNPWVVCGATLLAVGLLAGAVALSVAPQPETPATARNVAPSAATAG